MHACTRAHTHTNSYTHTHTQELEEAKVEIQQLSMASSGAQEAVAAMEKVPVSAHRLALTLLSVSHTHRSYTRPNSRSSKSL